MDCITSQGFIIYNVKVSVQSRCKMHQGAKLWNLFLASPTRGFLFFLTRLSVFTKTILVYVEDPARSSKP